MEPHQRVTTLPQERDEVSHSGVMAKLEEKRGDLAPVVGLVIEEVTQTCIPPNPGRSR